MHNKILHFSERLTDVTTREIIFFDAPHLIVMLKRILDVPI
jgi:hypothetical protein